MLGILQTDLLFVDTQARDIHENKMFRCFFFELSGFKSRSQSYFKNRCDIAKIKKKKKEFALTLARRGCLTSTWLSFGGRRSNQNMP